MKKRVKISLALFVIIVIIIAIGLLLQKENKKPQEENNINTENILTDETQQKQGNLAFREIKIKSYGATNIITGIVKNEGKKDVDFTLEMKMQEARNERTLGVAEKEMKNLKAQTEENFEISIIGDYTTVDKFFVQIKDLIEQP